MHSRAVIESFHSDLPVDIEGLVKRFGVVLDANAELDPEISGQIECKGGVFTISVNKDDHLNRKRFTMAHELGHYLLHRDLIGEGVDDTPAYRSTNAGNYFNTRIKVHHETEANRFAVWVLMPEDKVRETFQATGSVSDTARRFQVSTEAMRIRLQSLGLVEPRPDMSRRSA